jgi:hypothetical protein
MAGQTNDTEDKTRAEHDQPRDRAGEVREEFRKASSGTPSGGGEAASPGGAPGGQGAGSVGTIGGQSGKEMGPQGEESDEFPQDDETKQAGFAEQGQGALDETESGDIERGGERNVNRSTDVEGSSGG